MSAQRPATSGHRTFRVSDLQLFGEGERVIDLYAKVAHCALQLPVSQKQPQRAARSDVADAQAQRSHARSLAFRAQL
jgi:hypothetical protein